MSTTACQIAATVSSKGSLHDQKSNAGGQTECDAALRMSQACVAICDLKVMIVMPVTDRPANKCRRPGCARKG